MTIQVCEQLDTSAKDAVLQLWNEEYPSLLYLAGMAALDAYFSSLKPFRHLLLQDSDHKVRGWLFLFERAGESWFAMILAREVQGKGYGRMLLKHAGALLPVLHAWAIEETRYAKADGSLYPSPLGFYRKLGFEVLNERMEQPFAAVKIRWQRPAQEA